KVANRSPRARLESIRKRRLGKGRWLPLPLDELESGALTLREGAVLMTVLSLAAARADEQGFILLTVAYLRDGPLRLNAERQARVLGSLADKGLILVEGEGGKRRVKLLAAKLEDLFGLESPSS